MRTFIAILPPKAVAQQIQTALAELAINKPGKEGPRKRRNQSVGTKAEARAAKSIPTRSQPANIL
jgi:2'-5' RNA ligase